MSAPPRRGSWELFRYLPRAFRYVRPYRKRAFLSISLTILTSLVSLAQPWPLALMINVVVSNHPLPGAIAAVIPTEDRYALLAILVGTGFALTVLGNALNVFNTFVDSKIELGMVLDLRSELFEHCQRLSLTFHDARRTGELMSKINYQAASVGNIVTAFPPIAESILTLVGMLVISLFLSWQVALISLVVVPFLYYSAGLYGKRIVPRLERVQGLEWQSLSIVNEAMSMLRVIVSFGRERYEHRRFRDQGQVAVEERVRLTVRQTVFNLGGEHDHCRRDGAGLRLWGLPGNQGRPLPRCPPRASVLHQLRLPAARVDQRDDRHAQRPACPVPLLCAASGHSSPRSRKCGTRDGSSTCRGGVDVRQRLVQLPGRKDVLKGITFDAEAGQRIAIAARRAPGKRHSSA